MDISILLALQQMRQSMPSFIETFFVLLSYIGDGPPLVAIVLIVYWCVNKRAGQFSFIAFGAGNFVNQLLKNIVCAYRPWIRDSAIVPAEKAIEGATGYSFPSGHTTGTATSLGSFAWLARGKRLWITIVCVVVILLMMFARLFLGVHTPQDVLVGLLIAIVVIALTQLFFNWLDRWDAMMPEHNKDILVAVIVIVVSALSVAFVMLKPYPMDYVDGALLVDPVNMQKGSFEAAGIMIGMAIAWVLERRIVGFTTDGLDMRTRLIRFGIGVVLVGIAYVGCDLIFKAVLPYNWAKLFAMLVVVVVGIFVAPLVFQKFESGALPVSANSFQRGASPQKRSSREGSRRTGRSGSDRKGGTRRSARSGGDRQRTGREGDPRSRSSRESNARQRSAARQDAYRQSGSGGSERRAALRDYDDQLLEDVNKYEIRCK